MELREVASLIDHTILKPESTPADVERVCKEALEYGFGCVFVNSYYLSLASRVLAGSLVRLGSVAGFPLGATHTLIKVREAEIALENGALEVDMVVQIGLLKAGDFKSFKRDLEEVAKVVHQVRGANLKAILEVGLLTEEEISLACRLAAEAGVDYVKSCTGFGPRGVTVEDIKLMRKSTPSSVKIKASGGIRSYEQAFSLLDAGADRIGTSSSVAIIEEARRKLASD